MKRIDSPRDIAILFDGSRYLVTAVDSCGGIGGHAGDALRCPFETVGFHTARVALLEVLAAGASPEAATVAACNAPEAAERMLAGVRRAFACIGDIDILISTEKNMPTRMTALGVSVVGTCGGEALRVAKSRGGDLICLAGLPLVGSEVLEAGAAPVRIEQVTELLGNGSVHSLLPVGSRGIAAEASVLARESALAAVLDAARGVDFQKSAGPSSCLIFSALPEFMDNNTDPGIRIIGRLE